jgi:hypothetical protein
VVRTNSIANAEQCRIQALIIVRVYPGLQALSSKKVDCTLGQSFGS